MITYLALAVANAAVECPWPDGLTLEPFTLSSLRVNGIRTDVRGKARRFWFEDQLSACGYLNAADSFRRWRTSRRGVNWTMGVGILVFPYSFPWIASVAFGVEANRHKQNMIYSVSVGERVGVETAMTAGNRRKGW